MSGQPALVGSVILVWLCRAGQRFYEGCGISVLYYGPERFITLERHGPIPGL